MSYDVARKRLANHRKQQIAAMLGEVGGEWFASQWESIAAMLDDLTSSAENAAIASKYESTPCAARAGDHIRLDYICALRREVRKQYVSEEEDICTDVTPFRHGVISAHGASIFDELMDTIVRHAEEKAQGGK